MGFLEDLAQSPIAEDIEELLDRQALIATRSRMRIPNVVVSTGTTNFVKLLPETPSSPPELPVSTGSACTDLDITRSQALTHVARLGIYSSPSDTRIEDQLSR